VTQQNLGIIQNISQNGILIKVTQPVEFNYVELYFENLQGNQIEIDGKVIHCKENPLGHYEIGIKLLGLEYKNIEFVKALALYLQAENLPKIKISGFMAQ
jgi:hypothetical protein